MEYIPTTYKFVAVLNKKIPSGNLMNALAHATTGLSASYTDSEKMRFDSYIDKDGNEHKSISDNPYIILRADNSNKIRTLRIALVEAGIHFTDFTNTMTVGAYAEQKERTANTPEEGLEYYAICMFGEAEKLSELTKKFSLWRD